MAAHLVVWTALGALTHTKEREKPNFLIIFVDDMGIDQIQVQSRAEQTQHIPLRAFQFALQLLCIAPFGLSCTVAGWQHCSGSPDPRAPTLAMLCARSF
jgi:hypothetical protein